MFTKAQLWKLFLEKFKETSGKEFIQTPDSLENIKVLMYYFLKSDEFLNCQNLTYETKPDLKKGLLIIGGYGTGKTTYMLTFEKIFKNIQGYHFRSYNANEVVKMFEEIQVNDPTFTRKDFENKMTKGVVYFDDLKTERHASNFGKVNLIKEILEKREYYQNQKTFATCNFKQGFEGNISIALEEFGEYYGARVYDRLYSMFNVIHFTGESFRK